MLFSDIVNDSDSHLPSYYFPDFPMNLKQAPAGSSFQVTKIDCEGEVLSRLYALGVFPGAKVKVLRHAPMGDPIQLKVGRSLISIRKFEAETISIEADQGELT